MPRERKPLREKFQMWIDSNPDFYADLSIQVNDLFCSVCERLINSSTKYKVTRHVNSHGPSTRAESAIFFHELTEAFVAADIPFDKLNNPTFRNFLEKYMDQKVPHPSTLRNNYVTQVYDNVVKRIREDVSDNFVYFEIDETTDACERSVANFIVGALKSDGPSDSHLLASKILDKTNHETVVNCVTECFNYLWPSDYNYSNKILVMLTSPATYMIKAADVLSQKYPFMIHFTCAHHGLNMIAETIKDSFPLVNDLISTVKKVFLKAPTRRDIFREVLPDVPMPPDPVATRWDTWLQAVAYYDKYFEDVKNCIVRLDAEESNAVKTALTRIKEDSIREDIRYINSNFDILISAMQKLETRGLSLKEQFTVLNDITNKINNHTGPVSAIKEKMLNVFAKNPGYSILENICKAIDGTYQELPPNVLKYRTCINKFSYCPLSMVDIARSFSLQKLILSGKRRALTPANLEKLIVINFAHQNAHSDDDTNQ